MSQAGPESKPPGLPDIDLREWGGKIDGTRQEMNERLFMQLLVFDVPEDLVVANVETAFIDVVTRNKIPCVLYRDLNAPRGLAIISWSSEPEYFATTFRAAMQTGALARVHQRHDHTMIGRTYSHGHEPDLKHALLARPVENLLRDSWDWGVWYPLRRKGAFETLDPEVQKSALREHASIGMAYGRQEVAHDIRLACHGIDRADNEFVIGLVGQTLHPLSHVVQSMRKTKQTAEYIEKMGPFFVGHAFHKQLGDYKHLGAA